MEIDDITGAWAGTDAFQHHYFDQPLAWAIAGFLRQREARSVIDLGCGMGHYTLTFLNQGLSARGYDGNVSTQLMTGSLCQTANFTQPMTHIEPADWVVCLEVAEHIPEVFEETLLTNIDHLNKRGVVLSWAVPGQGGDGHFNERTNHYVVKRMHDRGYSIDGAATSDLRLRPQGAWFCHTLMVFDRVTSLR